MLGGSFVSPVGQLVLAGIEREDLVYITCVAELPVHVVHSFGVLASCLRCPRTCTKVSTLLHEEHLPTIADHGAFAEALHQTCPPSPITGPSRRRSIKPLLVAEATPRDQVAHGLEPARIIEDPKLPAKRIMVL